MSDAPLVYCRPDECSYCIALGRNLETALAELAALKKQLRLANIDCFNNEAELAEMTVYRDNARQQMEWLREERDTAQAALAELDRMLAALIDAHYGMSFHHIGDGDGLTADEAAEIRTYAKLRVEGHRMNACVLSHRGTRHKQCGVGT